MPIQSKVLHKQLSQALKDYSAKIVIKIAHPLGWLIFDRQNAKNAQLIEYLKPYQTPRQLVNKLVGQGLQIPNQTKASELIFHQNYFRLKAYFIPFVDQRSNTFFPGTQFDEIERLYQADQEIRNFLLPLLAELEIRIRAVLDNVLTSETKDPFWHLHPKHFNNYTDVERGLKKAYSRFATGKQEFVLHYRRKYFTRKSYRFKQVPPFWILSEVFTLEQLLSVARSLDKNRFVSSPRKNKLNACATPFGFNSYEALITNIKCILELRNICAHHSRLWNKNLQNPAGIAKLAIKEARANRLYSQLVMVRHMCKTQGVRDDIQPFFVTLFATVPVFRRDMTSMGFPHNWECHPFWI